MHELQAVLFSLNNEICGVESEEVYKIERYQGFAENQEVPSFTNGVVELRGVKIPVMDLNVRFGIGKTTATKKTKIIITLVGETLIGFLVNDVFEIAKFSETDIENAPESISKSGSGKYLKMVAKRDDKVISILKLSMILTQDELDELVRFVNNS